MRRIYICLHKRNVERSSDVGKGIALPPMLARSTLRKMVLEGRGKTQRGGQNAILVDIAHILPCSASFCLQTLRRMPVGGSVKVTFAFLAKLTLPPFLHHQTGRQLIGKPLFAVAFNPTLLADHRLLRSGKGCSDLKARLGLVLVQKGSETVRNLTGD